MISVAGHGLRNVTVWFSTDTNGKFASTSVAGLLGNSFWSRFDVTLDYRRHAAYITAAVRP
jgi:hypothetical protein